MRIKFDLTISGINFDSDKFMREYTGPLVLIDTVRKSDTNPRTKKFYDYESITLSYKDKYVAQYYDEVYEQSFINFFTENELLLIKYEYEEINLLISVYYIDQCNFEIFDNKSLKILSKWNVSLPISVYHEDDNGNLV